MLINSVDSTMESFFEALKAIQAKETKLDKKMDKLANDGAHIEAKYDIYEANLNLFDQQLDNKPEFSKAEIEKKLQDLTERMDEHSYEVDRLLSEDKEDEARALLHALTGLNLQAATLHDMLAVHNQEKHLADENGNPVQSIKDAQFVLNRDQKLVKDDNGELHLIKATDENVNEVWDAIKRDPVAKAASHADFQNMKQNPQAMSVKKVVQHNKVMENTMHSKQVAVLWK
ncbi:MAG: hypothetical protein M1486_05285, partial [Gammaproteobacteria bacterium]|nr:hypothetical protein [Gammaproteobacteria bacterium]